MSNELDKHIGETLGRYESSVDAEALWQAVKPPRKRKPWLWLLLLAGVIAVAGGLWSWSAMKQQDQVVEGDSPMVDHTVLSTEKDATFTIPESGEEVASTSVQESAVSEMPDAMSISSGTEKVKELPPATPTNKATEEKEIAANGNTVNDKNSTTLTKPMKLEVNQSVVDLSKEKTTVNSSDQNEEPVVVLSSLSESRQLDTEPNTETVPVLVAPAIETLVFGPEFTEEKEELTIATPVASAYRRSKNSPFFAQIDVAYFDLQRKLENKDSLNWDWASERTNSEQLLEGLSADLSFGYRSRSGWQFRGGIGYTQLNTLFASTVTTQTVDTVQGLTMLVYNPDNSVDSIFGSVAYYETTSRQKQTYNSIRQWELPLLAGYNFELGRLSLLVEAGVRLRLNRNWEGIVFNQDLGNNFQDLSTTDWYRTGLDLGLQGGIHLAYPIRPQIDILAGGSVRYNLQDFSGDNSPFTERYQLLGGQLGLRYRF